MAGLNVRFIGVPAPILREIISLEPGWRVLGERMLGRAKATCPVDNSEGRQGPHLRESLEVRFITGADPRILIGSSKDGQKLSWITDGTDPHSIDPVNAKALRWTGAGGTVIFARHVDHPGTKPNDFLLRAIREIAQETSVLGVA